MPPKRAGLSAYLQRVGLMGAVGLAIAMVLMAIFSWARTETHVLAYRVTQGQAAATCVVLSARLKVLGAEFGTRGSVRPTGPDMVEVTLIYNADPTAPLAWLTMPGKVEFRLVHPSADPAQPPEGQGAEEQAADYEVKVFRERRYVLTRLDELKTVENPFALERTPVLTIDGFREVEFTTVSSQKTVVLTFHFREEDVAAFASVTALHAGRSMAMLIDGELFFPPKEIEAAITRGVVQAGGTFYVPPLRRLARILNCGILPSPLERVDPDQ